MKYFFLLFSILTLSVLSAQAQENSNRSTTKTIEKEVVINNGGKKEKYSEKSIIVLESLDHEEIDHQVDSLIQNLNLKGDGTENVNVEISIGNDGMKTITIESTTVLNPEEFTRLHKREGTSEAGQGFEVEIDENRVDVEPLPKTTVSLGVEIDERKKIVSVQKGSAAEKAGLKKGDIIEKIDKQMIYSIHGLLEHLGSYQADDQVKLTYKRSGKTKTTKLKLDPK